MAGLRYLALEVSDKGLYLFSRDIRLALALGVIHCAQHHLTALLDASDNVLQFSGLCLHLVKKPLKNRLELRKNFRGVGDFQRTRDDAAKR